MGEAGGAKGEGIGRADLVGCRGEQEAVGGLEGSYLKVLQLIFKTIAESPTQRDLLKLPDASGACSVLGLLVANNQAAIDCVMGVYKEWPDMIAVPHLPGFFVGENAFHVLAANSQEATLCELIQMAYDNLPREKIKDCFTSQALGLFFSGPPMNQYGGTPIGYAASFCMRRRSPSISPSHIPIRCVASSTSTLQTILPILGLLADARGGMQRLYLHV